MIKNGKRLQKYMIGIEKLPVYFIHVLRIILKYFGKIISFFKSCILHYLLLIIPFTTTLNY